jgi:predicted ATPase
LVEEAVSLSVAHGLPLTAAMGSILMGWAVTCQGQLEEGIAQMRQGRASQLGTGAELVKPFWLYLAAEAGGRAGNITEGLALLDQAEAALEQTDERYWEAEIHRLRGQLLVARADPSDPRSPEDSYRRALDVARGQDARSLELRAAVSLALLRRGEGKVTEARELLAPVYEWFSEGFDTSDMREAAALLAELGGSATQQTTPIFHGGH